MDNTKLISIATKAVLLAGKKLLQAYNEEIIINSSKGKDIKLQADIESEKIILNILQKESNIPILSEEEGFLNYEKNKCTRWIVDPLDGSLNFSRNIPLNCISIGLWKNNIPLFGVIYNFLNDDIYIGEVGVGATLNGNKITVSSIDDLSKSILCTGFPVYSSFDTKNLKDFVINIQKFKKLDSWKYSIS